MKQDFDLDDSDSQGKSGGHFFTNTQIISIAITGVCIVTAVGLMCGLIPDRSCEPSFEATQRPTTREPTEPPRTEPPITEPPVTEPPARTTEPPLRTTDSSATTPIVTTDSPATSPIVPTEASWDGRLSYDVVPLRYDLYLKPYLYDQDLGANDRRFTFDGRVGISMRCDVSTSVITLHVKNINLRSYKLTDEDDNELGITSARIEDRYDFVHFDLDQELEATKEYFLEIDYLGELWEGLSGWYRSSYTEGNETRWLATSQMQPTSARRALPCFDEPDFKAVFHTRIEHRDDMYALSNGIEIDSIESENEGWNITEYEPTPRMSTYLLAFVVGYFDYTEAYTENNVRFRIWSRPEAVNSTLYARDIGTNITTYFEEYFDIPFPLAKQDMIAVPDFSAGAMENWGLIIYRETALLFDSMVNSASDKQWVNIVVSHELAHQWFGNLMTCYWWDDLWLNEGFASYVEGLGVDHSEPSWDMKEQFLTQHLLPVLEDDSLGTSHPVKVPVNSPDEIGEIFDSISYDKGASIIRMLNDILTEEVFVKGLNSFLLEHSEDTANSDDLWRALTEADAEVGGNDVKAIMDTWTLQMGYPVVDLRRIEGSTQVNASQEHFLSNPEAPVEDRYGDVGYLWYVYLTFTKMSELQFDTPQSAWLEKDPWVTFDLGTMGDDEWFLANIRQYGFFRVNYDDDNWDKLSQQLLDDHEVIPIENRAQLIDDAFNLARVGRLNYTTALELTLYMDTEIEFVPWEAALNVISYITDMFSEHPGYGPLERYMREQIQPLYDLLGWDDNPEENPHLEQFNRVNAIGTSCKYGNEDCLARAFVLYHEYMENDANNVDNMPDYEINPISPNLKTTVYSYGIQEGGQEEWDFGWRKYLETNDAAEKSKWRLALSYSKAPWILSRYLDYSLDPSLVRPQDSYYVIIYVSRNYIGQSIAWDYLRTNWEAFKEYYEGNNWAFSTIISGITEDFNTELERDELIAFGEGKTFGTGQRAYEQAIEKVNTNIAWMEDYADTVAQWLEESAPEIMGFAEE